METKIIESSGDVFRDLGFDASEAEDLRLRSELMISLQDRVRALNMSQAQVAEQLGVTQPRISDLLRGKLHRFSMDMLTQMLSRLGAQVSVRVEDLAVSADSAAVKSVWAGLYMESFAVQVGQRNEVAPVVSSGCDRRLAIAA